MMINAKNIGIVYQWFEEFSEQNPDIEMIVNGETDDAEGNPSLRIWSMFDYEIILASNEWRIFFDIGVRLPNVAAIMTRTQFQLSGEELNWDTVFVPQNLEPMIVMSIENAMIGFRDICNERAIAIPEKLQEPTSGNKEIIKLFCDELNGYYFSRRKPMDEQNTDSQYQVALTCPQVSSIELTLTTTFLIIDEVLFYNKHFKKHSNRKVFFERIPETMYYTIKNRCLEINKHPVELSQIQLQIFLECVSCASQILLSDKSDQLNDVLLKNKISDEVQKIYFKNTTNLFHACQTEGVKRELQNWTSLIN